MAQNPNPDWNASFDSGFRGFGSPQPQSASSSEQIPQQRNVFANDGSFMASFYASQHAPKRAKVQSVFKSHHQQLLRNDGSFLENFLAIQKQQQEQEKKQQQQKRIGDDKNQEQGRSEGTEADEEKDDLEDKPATSSSSCASSVTAASFKRRERANSSDRKQSVSSPSSTQANPPSAQVSPTSSTHSEALFHEALGAASSPSSHSTTSTASNKSSHRMERKPRRKRSRWDSGLSSEYQPSSWGQQDDDQYGFNGSSHTTSVGFDWEKQKQMQQQHELRFLEDRLRQLKQQHVMQSGQEDNGQLAKERAHEYARLALKYQENDRMDTLEEAEMGIIEDGTREHRKRAREMLQTLQTAETLTEQAKGKHHLGDFLPKEEVDKFIKKAQALSNGSAMSAQAPQPAIALEKSNVGYQMLQKAGWQEGLTIGKAKAQEHDQTVSGSASAVPTPAATTTRGLGAQDPSQLQREDDEFEQYRKRMMLAYRFRPNPLNNPRRQYS